MSFTIRYKRRQQPMKYPKDNSKLLDLAWKNDTVVLNRLTLKEITTNKIINQTASTNEDWECTGFTNAGWYWCAKLPVNINPVDRSTRDK
jgi:hypothetical protein